MHEREWQRRTQSNGLGQRDFALWLIGNILFVALVSIIMENEYYKPRQQIEIRLRLSYCCNWLLVLSSSSSSHRLAIISFLLEIKFLKSNRQGSTRRGEKVVSNNEFANRNDSHQIGIIEKEVHGTEEQTWHSFLQLEAIKYLMCRLFSLSFLRSSWLSGVFMFCFLFGGMFALV